MAASSVFVQNMLLVSEKAANIARAIRQDSHLLSLLVREKKDNEKNPRFMRDFKTLADVLVQEVVKHDLSAQFPSLKTHIYGEESNEFTNMQGETIHLNISDCENDTVNLLIQILEDEKAAKLLAAQVHGPVTNSVLNVEVLPTDVSFEIPIDQLAIWVDPIDSTAEYISGEEKMVGELYTSGLPCVTVLIGAFDRDTGVSVAGVINQPFYMLQENRWEGRCFWGVAYNDVTLCSVNRDCEHSKSNLLAISSSENPEIKARLEEGGFTLIEAAGAGYKLLCVILGLVGAYVLSKGSTYFWDTCSCGAVLKSLGGAVVDYKEMVSGKINSEVLYKLGGGGNNECCNKGGIIAYRNKIVLQTIIDILQK